MSTVTEKMEEAAKEVMYDTMEEWHDMWCVESAKFGALATRIFHAMESARE